jgi:spermidine synthase
VSSNPIATIFVPSRRQVLAVLYMASGAAALVYEVTWTRLLTLHLGHSLAAASTVLAAFMGGLALGSWIAGRVEKRLGNGAPQAHIIRLRTYAALEGIVALVAIVLPALLAALVPLLAWAYHDAATPIRFAVVRLVLCFVLIGIPATAMGATFPIVIGWYASRAAHAGFLYAANTAGAALGAIAAGFWLIPAVGLRATTWVGIALNVFSASGALWLASTTINAETEEPAEAKPKRNKRATIATWTPAPRLGMAAACISGFAALVYEVCWTRLLALVIGPTTYAFTTVVASFIIGLAIGSAAGARLIRRTSRPVIWLGGMLMLTAVASSIASWFASSRLPLLVASQVSDPAAAFGGVFARQAFGIGILLLPMTCALGATFSLALATALSDGQAIGGGAARVYGSNTLGAIAGALVGGFVLLPTVGLYNTFRVTATAGLIAALGVWVMGLRSQRRARGQVAMMAVSFAIAGSVVFLVPPWDLSLLASGAYKYAPYIDAADLEAELRAWQLLYYQDGSVATVGVRQLAGMRSLVIDGKVDASNMGDMLTQRMLGLLPVLLHADPQEICIIGLGSGVTVGSALAPGVVRHADVVEISPEVVNASAYFARENAHALDMPGVRLIVGDGRSHLFLSARRYDVIVSEPSNPWMAGIGALFTREFFEAARARLKPDGLICQWAHTYDISPDDLRSIVRTFGSVFPESTMWRVGEGDLLLIASNGAAIEPRLDAIVSRWQLGNTPALLDEVAIAGRAAPFALLSMFVGGPAAVKRFGANAAIQSDDRMALEFSAPRAIYGRATTQNAAITREVGEPDAGSPAARALFDHATDVSWAVAGAMELKADAYDMAYDRFRRAVVLRTGNAEGLAGLTDAAGGAHRQDEERAWLRSLAAAEPGNAPVRVELSRLLAAEGQTEEAAAAAEEAMRLAPKDPATGEQLASVFADAGDGRRLAPLAMALVSRFPDRDRPRYFHATALFLEGRFPEAIDQARQIVSRNPQDVRARNLLGVACAAAGLADCARAAFEAAIGVNPRDTATYVNLGVFHLRAGDAAAADRYFSVALALDRSSTPARQGLAEARAAVAGNR